MSNGWLDGMGTVAGILLGVAIPAQEAMRARKAIGAHLAERIHRITDAFDVAEALAQQALSSLSDPVPERADFTAACNLSYIEHILRRMDMAADDAAKNLPNDATAFIIATAHAQTSMHGFFGNLTAAKLTTFSPCAPRAMFDLLASDVSELHATGDRMLKMRHVGMSAIGMGRAFWDAR